MHDYTNVIKLHSSLMFSDALWYFRTTIFCATFLDRFWISKLLWHWLLEQDKSYALTIKNQPVWFIYNLSFTSRLFTLSENIIDCPKRSKASIIYIGCPFRLNLTSLIGWSLQFTQSRWKGQQTSTFGAKLRTFSIVPYMIKVFGSKVYRVYWWASKTEPTLRIL